MSKRITIISAHPDDEVLGMGGTIAKHTAAGDEVSILFMSDGVTGRDEIYDRAKRLDEINQRKDSARQAAKILHVADIDFEDDPNLRMDTQAILDITKKIERRFKKWQPEIVYTHHSSDTNIDHRKCFDATMIACRPIPGSTICSIRSFEVPSSTEYSVPSLGVPFTPNLYIDITGYEDIKKEAIRAYDYEIRPAPFPRSYEVLDAMSVMRGAAVGRATAEAFMEVRRIE